MRLISKWLMAAAALAAVSVSGPVNSSEAARPHPASRYVSALQTAETLAEGKERVYILDVRNDWEFSDYHIPGAVNIPVQVLAKPENLARLPKQRKIILYCRTGARADRALSILIPKGYDVRSIEGGIRAWWREVIEPPSATMSPTGDTAALYRKRQGLRNHFLSIPGAGAPLATPPGPPVVRKPDERPTRKPAMPPAEKKKAEPVPAPAGPPALQNPCG